MDTNLLDLVRKTVRSAKKPYGGFNVAIVTYPDGLITLRIYEDQIMEFSEDQRANILLYLEKVQQAVRDLGLRCEMEGVNGKPGGKRR
jgi:hypothetical protein